MLHLQTSMPEFVPKANFSWGRRSQQHTFLKGDLQIERLLEVLHLMAEGLTYNEIADQILVSLNTVRTHVKNIYSKLLVHKRSQAIAKARALNIL